MIYPEIACKLDIDTIGPGTYIMIDKDFGICIYRLNDLIARMDSFETDQCLERFYSVVSIECFDRMLETIRDKPTFRTFPYTGRADSLCSNSDLCCPAQTK